MEGSQAKMEKNNLTQGLPARIILETTIVQEEEVFKMPLMSWGESY